jgi:hypothetical protein
MRTFVSLMEISQSSLFLNSPVFSFASFYVYLYTVPPSVFDRPRSRLPWGL